MEKIRGFEKVTYEQFAKDIKEEFYLEGATVQKIYDNISLPTRSTAKSAGYDVVSPITFTLAPEQDVKIPLGVKVYMLDDEVAKVYPRSGLGFKFYTRLANTLGIIDADYYNNSGNEGHCWIKLRNEGTQTLKVNGGDKICQMIFDKYLLADGDNFIGEERIGGFNSTGN